MSRGLGALEVFETSGRFAGTLEGRRFDWRRLTPQRSAHQVVPGHDSGSMVSESHADTLGRLLAQRLRRARDKA